MREREQNTFAQTDIHKTGLRAVETKEAHGKDSIQNICRRAYWQAQVESHNGGAFIIRIGFWGFLVRIIVCDTPKPHSDY